MLSNTGTMLVTGAARITSAAARTLHTHPIASSSRAAAFWSTDEPLLKALRRRQESYRLSQAADSPRKKADRAEAVQLAKSEVRWIVEHVRKDNADRRSPLDRSARRKLVSMSTQMTRSHVPVSYLLGTMPFGSLPEELNVRPPILLPRPETEHWATKVTQRLIQQLRDSDTTRVADLCTGSGCIALLVADALRTKLGVGGSWRVIACDRSLDAVKLARENAVKLGFHIDSPGANLHIVQADVFHNADMDHLAQLAGGPFDLILSNPPYIPRREYNNLPPEVKEHEDPTALIGERHATSSTSTNIDIADGRQSYLDRAGLAFHSRLAELLYRPAFSGASKHGLPRLVAEYGKGQQKSVEKLHAELKAPAHRMPRVSRLVGRKLVVVGVGNATTHPNTRHSIGQVVMDPLLQGLIALDSHIRRSLQATRDRLETQRRQSIQNGTIDLGARPDWNTPVPTIPEITPPTTVPDGLTRAGRSGGWFATLPNLLVPSPSSPDDEFYSVEVMLFKLSQPMNLSGIGLLSFLSTNHPSFSPDDVLVLQDELDLPFSSVKRKSTGSARGHNGIRDIFARLKIQNTNLARVLIGIGRPESRSKPIDRWVLSRLKQHELDSCANSDGQVQQKVQEQVWSWIQERCFTLANLGRQEEKDRLRLEKDQFGVLRTVWVY